MFSPYDNGTAMTNDFVSLVPAGSDNTMAESTMGANINKFPGASATQKVWLDGVMNSDDEEEDYEEYKGLEKYENELNNGGKQNASDTTMVGDDDEDDH